MLQSRILSYTDTQRYRLGVNFNHLPINQSKKFFNPLIRNGAGAQPNLGGTPNYVPSSFFQPSKTKQYLALDKEYWTGTVVNFETEVTDADFEQPRKLWTEIFPLDRPNAKTNWVKNAASHLSLAVESVREGIYGEYSKRKI